MAERTFDLGGQRIWVAGHTGMLGRAILRRLASEPCEVLTVGRGALDLMRQDDVERWLDRNRPDAIVLAAAKVGGIQANAQYPASFLFDNLAITTNVIGAAARVGTRKLVNLGSSCMYPRASAQPIAEASLLTGSLEPTNEWYAVAKIAGAKMVEAFRKQSGCDFITVVPTNLYGPGDNFDPAMSHVIPGLMMRLDRAIAQDDEALTVWGTGTPRREFMYVDDAADGLVFLLQNYSASEPINLGTGSDVTIAELVSTLADLMAYRGRIDFDVSKPDGMPRKLLDSDRVAKMGWRAETTLRDGLARTYAWFLEERVVSA